MTIKKQIQEKASLLSVNDSFKKIVIVKDVYKCQHMNVQIWSDKNVQLGYSGFVKKLL